ncbi:hypothetical protein SAMN05421874_103346 [Nonomuraea maritima]|uniref:Uncharacterized protein n=1 Tax=Nonomuraea maritima TaxID=683260 RepID=A0A1G8WYN9_9ACTN|nr:hypothetical protein [Nonomuraea maritima]SDJ83502.1 hypothetical protein SAMN05421874_103346 [Nonomuraea maritima]
MTPVQRKLRDLFDDMSAGAPDNPGRIAQLERRIRRDSSRRSAGAALAGVSMLTAAGVLIPALLHPGPAVPSHEPTTAVQPAELPPRFTSGDGSAYRRLASTTLRARSAGEKKVSVTVPVSGKPLEVAVLCPEGDPVHMARPRMIVNGEPSHTWFQQCLTGQGMVLDSVSVPKSADEVTIAFDITDEVCKKDEPCPTRASGQPADWPLAVYEYTPPARPVEPDPIEAFPARLGTQQLAGQASGVWPRDSSFTLTVTSPGGYFRIEHRCTGHLAGRLPITYQIGDEPSHGAWICGHRTLDETNGMLWTEKIPEGTKVTISGKVDVPEGDHDRQTRWSVAVYSSKIVKLAR